MTEETNRKSVVPGSPEAREQLKSQLGFTLTPPPLPDELGQRTVKIINDYNTQSGEFREGTPLYGQSAQEILEKLQKIKLQNGNNEKLGLMIGAFEEISKEETKIPMMQQISTSFGEAWNGISTGVRKSEQGTLDAIFNPMLDLAGIRITEDGVHISSPKHVPLPDGTPSQQIKRGLIKGQGTGWSNLPPESARKSLITIPGGPEPETWVGETYEGLTQAGMSWAIGDKTLNTAKALQTAIPKLKNFFSTPAVQGVLNTATGEALTLQAKDRFAGLLVEMGVDSEALKYIAGAPDEDAFTARFKSYLDGAFTAMGAGIIIEPILKLGRAGFNMGWFAGKEKNPEKAAALLDESEKYLNRLLNTVPSVDDKTGKFIVNDPLVKIQEPVEESVESGVDELQQLEKKLKDEVGVEVIPPTIEDIKTIIERGDASHKYVFHTSNNLEEVVQDGLGIGGLSGTPVEDEGYGEFVHVFLREDLPESMQWADLGDVSLYKEYKKNIKPIATFVNDDLGDYRGYGSRAEELGDGPQPKVDPKDDLVTYKKQQKLNEKYRKTIEKLYGKSTKRSESVLPANKEPSPVQADDININEFFNIDPYKDVAFGDTTVKINFDRIDSINSVKELFNRMLIQIEQANPTSLSYGPKGKARKLKDGTYVTKGNVLTFEEIKKRAGHAEKQLRDMGYSPERFVAGFKATTETLPHLMLASRDLVVGKLTWMDEKVKAWKQIRKDQDGTLTPKQKLKFVQQLLSSANMVAEMRGSQRDIARAQAAQRINSVDSEKRITMYEAIIKDVTGSLTVKGGEAKLFKMIDHLDSLESVNQFANVFKKNNITRIFDAINFMGINSFLANLSTQTVNNVGSFALLNLLTAEKYIGAASRILPGVGGAGEVNFNEANAHVFGIVQSLFESSFIGLDENIFRRSALGQGWEGFKELDTGLQNYDIDHVSGGSLERFAGLKVPDAFNAAEFEEFFKLKPGTFPDYLRTVINGTGTIMGLPGRMLMSGDGFFRSINYRSAIHSLAMRRASEEGLTGRELQKRYTEIVKNLPEDIDQLAQTYAQVSLFQQNLDKGGIEGIFKAIEDSRKRPLMDSDKGILRQLLVNPASSFLTSKIPFFKTPYNIFKQTLIERNPAAHLMRYVGGALDQWGRWVGGIEPDPNNYRAKFHSDEAFKQDVIAKSTTGGMFLFLGYSLGGGDFLGADKAREVITPEGTDVSITGGSDPTFTGRDIAQDQLRQQPEIFIRNLSTLDATSIPIGRADPIASLVMAGSIIGNYEAFTRNHVDPFRDEGNVDVNNLQAALDERQARLMFQVGNFFMDKAMLRGLSDIFQDTVAPNADPSKLARDYVTKFAGQAPLANFWRGIKSATENQRMYPEGRIKEVYVPTEEGDVKKSRTNFEIPNLSKEKLKHLSFIDKLLREWADEWRKVNILDMDPQTNDPIIRTGAVPMVDLEGNPIGFNDREVNIYERFLEQNLIPFSGKKVNETNTSVLISGLDIKFTHPKRWTHLTVGNEKIPLSSEQKLYWAVKFGLANRNSFKQDTKLVNQLKKHGLKLAERYTDVYLDNKVAVYKKLQINKNIAKMDMIQTYPELQRRWSELQIKNSTETMIGE